MFVVAVAGVLYLLKNVFVDFSLEDEIPAGSGAANDNNYETVTGGGQDE